MKTCIFPPWLCPCSSYFLPSPSLISSWAVTPRELHRMLALNRFLGKGLTCLCRARAWEAVSEGTGPGHQDEGKGAWKTAGAG